jgi:glycosyltransferase involved in cell wall biosynthesis
MKRSPYKIAFIDHTTRMGGGQVYLLRQLSQLDRSRFEPIVVCPSDGDLPDHVRRSGVRVHLLPVHPDLIELRKEALFNSLFTAAINGGRFVFCVVRLAWWLRREGVALAHLNSMKAGFYGGMAAWLAGIPVVWDFKDIVSEDFFPSFNRRLIIRIGNAFADRIVANSHAIAQSYTDAGGKKEKVEVIHNGIDLTHFHPSRTDTMRSALGIASDAPVVSIFSRLDRWKGHVYFLNAAARARARFPGVRFLVVGATTFDDPGYTDELLALTRALNLEDCVHFLGFRTDIAELMAASDILVHASTLPEPLGLTPMEAQAAGRAVVAVGAGGVMETVEHNITGLLVPPENAEAIAESLLTLLNDPDRRHRMGQAGRARAERLFDLRVNARRVQDVYIRLIEKTDETRHSP